MNFPSPTKNWHTDTYASLSPTRPEVSVSGKRIVITGGGYGIGRELTKTFAQAGAAEIAILGRTESALVETQTIVTKAYPKTKISYYIADVTNEAAVKKAASAFGTWNTLVMNAGYLPDSALVRDTNIDEFWKGYEVNVKGPLITINAFLPTKGKDAVVVGVSTGGIIFPKPMAATNAGYISSKQAMTNLLEYIAAEEPDVHFVTVHPGVIETAMFVKSKMPMKPDSCKSKSLNSCEQKWDKFLPTLAG